MKTQCYPALAGALALVLPALLATGCSSSTNESPELQTQQEIRGEPITPEALSVPASAVVSSDTVATNTPLQPTQSEPSGDIKPNPSPTSPPGPGSTPVTASKANEAEGASPSDVVDGFTTVTFDKLASFEFQMPDDPASTNETKSVASEQIPANIKALDEKPIALKGFMLPLKVESGLVTEMLIMRDQSMCCFGTVPKINEWVSVKMTEKGVKPVMDQPVTIFGKLFVGEMRENGYLVGIYRMDGQKMAGPLDF